MCVLINLQDAARSHYDQESPDREKNISGGSIPRDLECTMKIAADKYLSSHHSQRDVNMD